MSRFLAVAGGGLLAMFIAMGSPPVALTLVGVLLVWIALSLSSLQKRTSHLENELKRLRAERAAPAPVAPTPAAPAAAPIATVVAPVVAAASEPRPAVIAAPAATSTPPRAAPLPPRPRVPAPELAIVRVIREFFTGGNTVVRVGIVILFIGVAFLLRYAAERTHIPIELRLYGVALGAFVLLALGWRLRHKRPGYALALQGGAVGILYLLVFASMRLLHLLPEKSAFLLLVLISAAAISLAVVQNALSFTLLGIGGGFLAPILASSGQGDHVTLFSYYSLLNLTILVIAWFKSWRALNVMGFVFTFGIGAVWGVLRYDQALFASTEPFLIGFFLLYVLIAILFATRQPPELRGIVDGTIVFGVPAVALALQSSMVHHWPYAMAKSAAAVGVFYLVLAIVMRGAGRTNLQLLVQAFTAIGVAALTLAIPLSLDDHWTAGVWALEGAALVWIGCRQDTRFSRIAGLLLQIGAGVFLEMNRQGTLGNHPVLNSACIGALLVVGAALYSAWLLQASEDELPADEGVLSPSIFLWGLAWAVYGGMHEIDRFVAGRFQPASFMVLFTVVALLSSACHRRLQIGIARFPPLLLLPLMLLFAFGTYREPWHPLHNGFGFAWPIAFAGVWFILRRHERAVPALLPLLHTAAVWLLVLLGSAELAWQVQRIVGHGGSWEWIAWAILPALAVLSLPRLRSSAHWPFAAHGSLYTTVIAGGAAVVLALWSVLALELPADAHPLRFIPLLNPLDVAQALVILVIARYAIGLQNVGLQIFTLFSARAIAWWLAAIGFLWLNAALLRAIHHIAQVPYDLDRLLDSTLVQTSLSIFWTVIALASMLLATRRGSRVVWIAGGSLLAIVVAKLMLVDLSSIGTVERIVSFLGVGLLMLVVGYVSPLPPVRKAQDT